MDMDRLIAGDATRRQFLRRAAAVSAGFGGLSTLMRQAGAGMGVRQNNAAWGGSLAQADFGPVSAPGYGPLKKDPAGILDLPDGFSYRVLTRVGEEMDDGLLYPGKPDAMCALPRPDGTVALLSNHEIEYGHGKIGPFGKDLELVDKLPREALYDDGGGVTPQMGGVTITVFDPRTKAVKRRFLALAGTIRNCAGGPTPWGSWLSCEEVVYKAGKDQRDGTCAKDHGYLFEVPAATDSVILNPQPMKAMGRFYREAVCVDPATGIVYQTEDRPDGLFYRFVPKVPGRLAEGGTFQVMTIRDPEVKRDKSMKGVCTRNWGDGPAIRVGQSIEVGWVDVEDPENPQDRMRHEYFFKGAARFARGEGMWWGNGSAYFCCTNGGPMRLGQIWKYVPSGQEGTPGEKNAGSGGRLELFVESLYSSVCRNADNITVSPWGDLIVCEDNDGASHLLGVTPDGRVYRLGYNAIDGTEFAGACFSPDGTILFVNLQAPGLTLMIEGPWQKA